MKKNENFLFLFICMKFHHFYTQTAKAVLLSSRFHLVESVKLNLYQFDVVQIWFLANLEIFFFKSQVFTKDNGVLRTGMGAWGFRVQIPGKSWSFAEGSALDWRSIL
jgi:hypothetical protein